MRLFPETNHNVTLDPDETFHIATISSLNQRFQYAVLWMEETLRKLNEGEEAVVTKEEVIYQLASFSHQLAVIQLSSRQGKFTRTLINSEISPPLYISGSSEKKENNKKKKEK